MNYTPNYRLPQWEKPDRIMMDDFNRMCANIEAGLTGGADATAHLQIPIENLCRDLYRQTAQQRLFHGQCGETDSMWVNALTTRDEAGDNTGWNGRYGIRLEDAALPTLNGIAATAKEEAWINTWPDLPPTPISYRAAVTFISNGYGTLENVKIWNQRHQYDEVTAAMTLSLKRLDTGAVVGQTTIKPRSHPNVKDVSEHAAGFPLEAGIRYRLELVLPDSSSYQCRCGILLESKAYDENYPIVAPITLGPRAIQPLVRTVTPPEFARGAIVLMRWRGNGSATLSVNGDTLTGSSRDTVNAEGQACREVEFRMDTLPKGPLTVKLEVIKGTSGTAVFDYGFIWQ